ncbi:MAG: aminoglycoside adenylyltransferase domain-containing protein [Cellulomonadaceae bacterium]
MPDGAPLDLTLRSLTSDERNTLLTLARIVVTPEAGQIVSEDDAAQTVAETLDLPGRALLTAEHNADVRNGRCPTRQGTLPCAAVALHLSFYVVFLG